MAFYVFRFAVRHRKLCLKNDSRVLLTEFDTTEGYENYSSTQYYQKARIKNSYMLCPVWLLTLRDRLLVRSNKIKNEWNK